jgi:hypothetical protein
VKRGIYIGHQGELRGKVADVKPSLEGGVAARFIDTRLPTEAPGEWVQYSRSEFDLSRSGTP